MTRLLLSFALAMSILFASGQSKKDTAIQHLFDKAQDQLEDSLFTDAVTTYKRITQIAAVNSTPFSKATYNIGYVYLMMGNDDSARQVFTRILTSSFNEMDGGGKGSGIMGEPYALYKHNACDNLAGIELRENNFAKALEYIKLFDKKYPYRHFCGNEIAEEQIYTADMYCRAYLGLHDTASAINSLLPHVFADGLASNTEIVNRALRLLHAKYDRKYLAEALDKAIDNLSEKTIKQKKYKYVSYQIVFLGVPIEVPDASWDAKPGANTTELEQRKAAAKSSDFYKGVI